MQNRIETLRKKKMIIARRRRKILMTQGKFPFYTLEDTVYSHFLTDFLQMLNVSKIHPSEIIFTELQEPTEMYFVIKGTFNYGYEINKRRKFRLQGSDHSILGGYQCIFNYRHQYVIKSVTEIQGFMIKRMDISKLFDQYPLFAKQIQRKCLVQYIKNI